MRFCLNVHISGKGEIRSAVDPVLKDWVCPRRRIKNLCHRCWTYPKRLI